MTFTEAAVEVLRRAGKPLHYHEIAEVALRDNLLSHVGQDPEITMGQRLAAMAKREDDRKVVAVLPEGTFALIEWAVPQEAQVEAVAPPTQPEESGEPLYRPREREPRAIHAQARRRLAELQAEHEEGYEGVEAERRRQDQGHKGQRRFPPPAEVVFEALAQRQSGVPLSELAAELLRKQLLSDALVRDLPSLVAALLEDNRRRTEAGRKPAFIVDGERVTLVEFPPPSAPLEEARAPQLGARPMGAAQLGAEVRRAITRALRRRIAELDTTAFENLCAALLEKMGMRDVRVAKRSKEGPLYLARQRRGVSDLRVAVKLVRGGREIGRADVQELRKEMIACRVGVTVQTVEVPDVDEAFFAGLLRHREERLEGRVRTETESRGGERRHDRDERPQEESLPEMTSDSVTEVFETAVQPEPVPEAQPPEAHEGEAAAPAPSGEPASPPVEGEEPREVRRRRGREDRPRATNAAEQAWGQPAGTMKFAPPPGPTVVAQPTSREDAKASPPSVSGEAGDDASAAPEEQKPEGF